MENEQLTYLEQPLREVHDIVTVFGIGQAAVEPNLPPRLFHTLIGRKAGMV